MKTKEIAFISVFTAIIVASNYALIAFPQVKLMDSMVFLSGYLFGFPVAASIAALSWLVYGSINPLGAAGFPLILGLMSGEMIFGIFGVLCRRIFNIEKRFLKKPLETTLVLGAFGVTGSFIYDIWTNSIEGFLIYQTVDGMILRIITGIPFSIIHQISNFAMFSILVPIFIYMVTKNMSSR
ncbi:MAG TPA: hypothetical protein EYM50_02990 [Nitrososphaerales archaeon]|nr:hypothetical protein [Nitrososphaerales archaeon]